MILSVSNIYPIYLIIETVSHNFDFNVSSLQNDTVLKKGTPYKKMSLFYSSANLIVFFTYFLFTITIVNWECGAQGSCSVHITCNNSNDLTGIGTKSDSPIVCKFIAYIIK